MGKQEIFTIGHSTRELKEFLEILDHYTVTLLADVRTVPRSRHNPQFNKDMLLASLKQAKIRYEHMSSLGGLRHSNLKDSPNTGWRNASFRNYADYMQTARFDKALNLLMEKAGDDCIAIMCAEAVPWRCHRSLIADALLIRGFEVLHIFSSASFRKHVLTPWARVRGLQILYPPEFS